MEKDKYFVDENCPKYIDFPYILGGYMRGKKFMELNISGPPLKGKDWGKILKIFMEDIKPMSVIKTGCGWV